MTFTLPDLPYAYDALEPAIDEETMKIHHTKHHQTYVNNLNQALEGHEDLQDLSLEDLLSDLDALPESVRLAVRNNGGGHHNHSLFWTLLRQPRKNNEEGMPENLRKALEEAFGSIEDFQETFTQAATGRFGSGWAWLVKDKDGNLSVLSTPNQDSPLSQGYLPLLGLDVWEHAYYLRYQNRRPEYIENFWSLVDWDRVNELFVD